MARVVSSYYIDMELCDGGELFELLVTEEHLTEVRTLLAVRVLHV